MSTFSVKKKGVFWLGIISLEGFAVIYFDLGKLCPHTLNSYDPLP